MYDKFYTLYNYICWQFTYLIEFCDIYFGFCIFCCCWKANKQNLKIPVWNCRWIKIEFLLQWVHFLEISFSCAFQFLFALKFFHFINFSFMTHYAYVDHVSVRLSIWASQATFVWPLYYSLLADMWLWKKVLLIRHDFGFCSIYIQSFGYNLFNY